MGETGVAASWQGWGQRKAESEPQWPPPDPGSGRKGPSRDSGKKGAPPAPSQTPGWLYHMAGTPGLPEEKPLSPKALEPSPPAAPLSLTPRPPVLPSPSQFLPYPAPILSPNPIPPPCREPSSGAQRASLGHPSVTTLPVSSSKTVPNLNTSGEAVLALVLN